MRRERRCCLANAGRAGSAGGRWLKHKEGLLANASAALQNTRVSEAGCEFNLELVLFQMPARSMLWAECVRVLRWRWRSLRLLKTQTSDVREEVPSATWISKVLVWLPKLFIVVGWSFLILFLFLFGRGKELISKVQGKMGGGKTTTGAGL